MVHDQRSTGFENPEAIDGVKVRHPTLEEAADSPIVQIICFDKTLHPLDKADDVFINSDSPPDDAIDTFDVFDGFDDVKVRGQHDGINSNSIVHSIHIKRFLKYYNGDDNTSNSSFFKKINLEY